MSVEESGGGFEAAAESGIAEAEGGGLETAGGLVA